MKKFLLLTALLSVLVSCGGRKQMEQALYSGNYDQAIETALRKLDTNKDKKRKWDFIVMLQEAYEKVTERDLSLISRLETDGNPENYKSIYNLYTNMETRQEAIKPLMPLVVDGRVIAFKFNDYTTEIVDIKSKLSEYEYNEALVILDENEDKLTIREAYNRLSYIERINPNYKDIRNLMDKAHARGTDYVLVSVQNFTNQIIPRRLEEDLLDFNAYGLNDFWTVYQSDFNSTIDYDYAMELQLKRIQITPERTNQNQILKQREIVDGKKYLLDEYGQVVKDSLGNDIKVDNVITVKARFFEVNQFKSAQIVAEVVTFDLKRNQTLQSFPIDSGFVFENAYATYRGDKRALDNRDWNLVNSHRAPFPSNEQMVYDSGEDLKLQLKNIIKRNTFRS